MLAWLGVGALLLALPATMTVLRIGCFAYLLWLAWQIVRDGRVRAGDAPGPEGRPLTVVEGMLFQLINPKAWMMAITAASAFYGGARPGPRDLAAAILVCISIGGPSMIVWTAWGAAIDHLLRQPRTKELFSYAMAALVVASAVWMLR